MHSCGIFYIFIFKTSSLVIMFCLSSAKKQVHIFLQASANKVYELSRTWEYVLLCGVQVWTRVYIMFPTKFAPVK